MNIFRLAGPVLRARFNHKEEKEEKKPKTGSRYHSFFLLWQQRINERHVTKK